MTRQGVGLAHRTTSDAVCCTMPNSEQPDLRGGGTGQQAFSRCIVIAVYLICARLDINGYELPLVACLDVRANVAFVDCLPQPSKVFFASVQRKLLVSGTQTTVVIRLRLNASPCTTRTGRWNPGSEPDGSGKSAHQTSPCEITIASAEAFVSLLPSRSRYPTAGRLRRPGPASP
jgi:hypothetical protein